MERSPYLVMASRNFDQYERVTRKGAGSVDADGDLMWACCDDTDVAMDLVFRTRSVSAQIPEGVPPQLAARQLWKMAAWLLTQPSLMDAEQYSHSFRKFFGS